MATSSFDKEFVLDDKQSIKMLKEALENKVAIVFEKKDIEKEEKLAIDVLKCLLSR